MKITTEQIIQLSEWDKTVEETYKRPYSFQQQYGCQNRRLFRISIPNEADDYENDAVPEIVNHEKMGVSFKAWLERNPKKPLKNKEDKDNFSLRLWWERNFYPDIQMVANDLYKKKIIKKGDYIIEIDW